MKKIEDNRGRLPWPAKLFLIIVLVSAFTVISTILAGAALGPKDNLQDADLIIVISGGGLERLNHGVSLYQKGWAEKILFSGAAMDPDSLSNAESMRQIAIKRGVPEKDILIEGSSLTTYQNAINTKEIIEDRVTQIILVTSAYHQRRAVMTFKAVYGDEVEFINAPAEVGFFKPWNWWQTEKGRHLLFAEYGKIIYAAFTGKYERD